MCEHKIHHPRYESTIKIQDVHSERLRVHRLPGDVGPLVKAKHEHPELYNGHQLSRSDFTGLNGVFRIRFAGEAVAQIAAHQFDRPQPDNMTEELREVLP